MRSGPPAAGRISSSEYNRVLLLAGLLLCLLCIGCDAGNGPAPIPTAQSGAIASAPTEAVLLRSGPVVAAPEASLRQQASARAQVPAPPATRFPAPPQSLPSPTAAAPSPTPTPTAAAAPAAEHRPVVVNGVSYDAYVPAAMKKHQVAHFTCEFDAAWVVLKTNGFDVTLEEQLAITGQDKSIEPYYNETASGIFIYGGDITEAYSGDYKTNFLARTTGLVMRRVFEHYGLRVTPVHDRAGLEAALLSGQLVWIKTTADFKPGRPATWVMPDGRTYRTVLGNDHATVVMGFNKDGALIRDVLGPTNTNWQRQYEYLVPWPKFMAAWASQSYDGLAVGGH